MLSAAYLLLFSTLFGLVCPKPVVDNNDHPISIEQAAIHLTPEVREKIENTLDQFFAEQVFISPRENNQINEQNKRKGKEE